MSQYARARLGRGGIRSSPEEAIRGSRARTLIKRDALLPLQVNVAEDVLVLPARRPTYSARESLVARPRIVQVAGHDDVRKVPVLDDREVARKWNEIVLEPIERSLEEELP